MGDVEEKKFLPREGIKLFLNNKFDEAKELFSNQDEDIKMAAGYCFITFMNALMSFEEEKLEESMHILKEIKRKCSQEFGWLKPVKNVILSTFNYSDEDLIEKLEKKIILADSHLCVALLTFLQQDFTSFVKGSWVLMKAWKTYQDCYTQISSLYKKTFGSDAAIPGCQKPTVESLRKSVSGINIGASSSNATLSRRYSVPNSPINESDSLLSPGNTSIAADNGNNKLDVDPDTVARLMAAVSFGYGIFQLCISLHPSSYSKVIHFLGFEGNREAGLSALMFCRKGNDMRGPLASLILLWYHTIVRPFLKMDGSNIKAGANEAELLIKESQEEFGESALFLFFKGRVERLKSNIPESLKAYENAMDKTNQPEVLLLCLSEIGWCYLILLDWGNAFHCFNKLRVRSKWSRSFYTYLNMVCLGALGETTRVRELAEKFQEFSREESGHPQIKNFVNRRVKKFQSPVTSDFPEKLSCEMFLLELLYFWDALPSCNPCDLKLIVEECKSLEREPMPGLYSLIEGAVCACTTEPEKAVASFKTCLEKRNVIKSDKTDPDDNDDHIPAFASFELASILIQDPETLEEGKRLLRQVQNDYKGYDFEYSLTTRVDSLLKRIKN